LAYYSWRNAGVNISNGGATTASAEGQKLDEAGQTVSFDEIQPGDLIFYSYTNNGRYKNISHVAIYEGGGKVVEARSEKYGVVYREVPNIESIVFIGRP
jgi:cell wall-associated NlpC family hydrolase